MDDIDKLRNRGGWWEDKLLKRTSPPFGPWNTYSNLTYALVGAIVAWGRPDHAPFAVAMWLLATGSALYHSEKTIHANKLDWLGMFAVFGAVVAHAYGFPDWVALALGGLLGYGYLASKRLHADAVIGTLLVVAALGPRTQHERLALGVFALSYLVSILDKQGLTGRWGHGLWHCSSGIALGLLIWD